MGTPVVARPLRRQTRGLRERLGGDRFRTSLRLSAGNRWAGVLAGIRHYRRGPGLYGIGTTDAPAGPTDATRFWSSGLQRELAVRAVRAALPLLEDSDLAGGP